jgi:hypothetical protein
MNKHNQIRKFELYDLLSIDDGNQKDMLAYKFLRDTFTSLTLTVQEDGCFTYSFNNKILVVYEPKYKNIFIKYDIYVQIHDMLDIVVLDTSMAYFAKKYLNLIVRSVDYMTGISNHRIQMYTEVIKAKQINDHINAITA